MTVLPESPLPVEAHPHSDPLPSWNDGASRQRILQFVADVVDPQSASYVKPADRVAVFDNDGTLWPEQPFYFQVAFAFDRIHELAPSHPEWTTQQPFKAVLEHDFKTLGSLGAQGIVPVLAATHAGMAPDAFTEAAEAWMKKARHPRFKVPYSSLIYQPMLELLEYLRASDFKVFIVTGGGVSFVRAFSETVYSIPRERVIGSRLEFTFHDADFSIMRDPKLGFIDDGAGKPAGIEASIGRRPILAVGNSDGDLQMLQYTTAGKGARLGMIVRHDDAEREYAYDASAMSHLDKALIEAPTRGWTIISMKNDFKTIFPSRA